MEDVIDGLMRIERQLKSRSERTEYDIAKEMLDRRNTRNHRNNEKKESK